MSHNTESTVASAPARPTLRAEGPRAQVSRLDANDRAGRRAAALQDGRQPTGAAGPKPAIVSTPMEATERGSAASPPSFTAVVVHDIVEWDALVARTSGTNVFCGSGWGGYKQRTGWSVERIRVDDGSGQPVALCSVSSKRKLGFRVLHIQGGPVLIDGDDDRAREALDAIVDHLQLARSDLVFVSPYFFGSPTLTLALLQVGFSPVITQGDFTLMLDLASGLGNVEAGLNRSWRRTLKKSQKSLVARFPDTAADRRAAVARLAPMYAGLASRKSFEAKTSVPDLADVVADDPRWIVVEVLDGDEVVAIRIAHIGGDLVTDWIAATSEAALRSNAGYFAMWSLVGRAVALGAKRLDCGGIDPYRNPGVFRFKRGISRDVRQSEPIWLYSRSRLLRSLVAAFLVRA